MSELTAIPNPIKRTIIRPETLHIGVNPETREVQFVFPVSGSEWIVVELPEEVKKPIVEALTGITLP